MRSGPSAALVPLLAGALSALPACSGERARMEQAAARFAQHEAAFGRLDRWARRALQGAEGFRDPRALTEALFAKARAEDALAGAWVQDGGGIARSPRTLAWPEGAPVPALAHAVQLRDPALGALEVAVHAACPQARGAARLELRCTVVARAQVGERGSVRVVAAFVEPAARR